MQTNPAVEQRIPAARLSKRQEVAVHPETRDHRRDMRSRQCYGHHRSSCRCQVLLEQHHWNRERGPSSEFFFSELSIPNCIGFGKDISHLMRL